MRMLFVVLVFLFGCSEPKKDRGYEIAKAIEALHTNSKPSASTEILDDANAIISRSKEVKYTLLLPKELEGMKGEKVVIINTSPKGAYVLGLISGAKNFEFPNFLSQDDENGQLSWQANGGSKEDFIKKIGIDKNAKIVFYDNGDFGVHPAGSSHVGAFWAKKLGYTNVYRLVGGLEAWRGYGYEVSLEAPSCCK